MVLKVRTRNCSSLLAKMARLERVRKFLGVFTPVDLFINSYLPLDFYSKSFLPGEVPKVAFLRTSLLECYRYDCRLSRLQF